MKSLYFIPAFLLLAISNAWSQYIDEIPLSEIQSEYIELTTTGSMFKNRVVVYIDYGQEGALYTSRDHLLTDEFGKPMEFKSNVHVLNFMFDEGYELKEVYVIPSETSGSAYFVLRKKKT